MDWTGFNFWEVFILLKTRITFNVKGGVIKVKLLSEIIYLLLIECDNKFYSNADVKSAEKW
jgi:hypothetical protein